MLNNGANNPGIHVTYSCPRNVPKAKCKNVAAFIDQLKDDDCKQKNTTKPEPKRCCIVYFYKNKTLL